MLLRTPSLTRGADRDSTSPENEEEEEVEADFFEELGRARRRDDRAPLSVEPASLKSSSDSTADAERAGDVGRKVDS